MGDKKEDRADTMTDKNGDKKGDKTETEGRQGGHNEEQIAMMKGSNRDL